MPPYYTLVWCIYEVHIYVYIFLSLPELRYIQPYPIIINPLPRFTSRHVRLDGKSNEIAVIRFISHVYPVPIRLMMFWKHISFSVCTFFTVHCSIYGEIILCTCLRYSRTSLGLDWISWKFNRFSIPYN